MRAPLAKFYKCRGALEVRALDVLSVKKNGHFLKALVNVTVLVGYAETPCNKSQDVVKVVADYRYCDATDGDDNRPQSCASILLCFYNFCHLSCTFVFYTKIVILYSVAFCFRNRAALRCRPVIQS